MQGVAHQDSDFRGEKEHLPSANRWVLAPRRLERDNRCDRRGMNSGAELRAKFGAAVGSEHDVVHVRT
jgi:hypothetical protein